MGDNRNGALLGLNKNGFGVKDCTGGTHPRTQQCPVRGGLMLRMVSGMFGSLRLSQAPNGEYTEYKRYRKELTNHTGPIRVTVSRVDTQKTRLSGWNTRRRKEPLSRRPLR